MRVDAAAKDVHVVTVADGLRGTGKADDGLHRVGFRVGDEFHEDAATRARWLSRRTLNHCGRPVVPDLGQRPDAEGLTPTVARGRWNGRIGTTNRRDRVATESISNSRP